MFTVQRRGVKLIGFGECPAGALIQNGDEESSLGVVTRDADRAGIVWLAGPRALTFSVMGSTAMDVKFVSYLEPQYSFNFNTAPVASRNVDNGVDYTGLLAIDESGLWLVVRQLRAAGYDVRRLLLSDWTMHPAGDIAEARYVSSWELLVGLAGADPSAPRVRVAAYDAATRDAFWARLPNR